MLSPLQFLLKSATFGYETNEKLRLTLADTELWVESQLMNWMKMGQCDEDSCSALANIVSAYMSRAALYYRGDPENFSIMVLTLMELWVALDKYATRLEPLLLDYNTGMCSSFS